MGTGTPVHCTVSTQSGDEWAGRGGGCGECARAHYTVSTQSGMSGQAREEEAASVHGYTGTLHREHIPGTSGHAREEGPRVHGCLMSKPLGCEWRGQGGGRGELRGISVKCTTILDFTDRRFRDKDVWVCLGSGVIVCRRCSLSRTFKWRQIRRVAVSSELADRDSCSERAKQNRVSHCMV